MIEDSLVESLAYETAFWMAGVYNPTYPAHLLGELATDVSTKLRSMAGFRLLADGNSNSFYHNLMRSGLVREVYLKRCFAENLLLDHFRSSGRYLAVCDTIVSGDFSLAVRVIDLSPLEFMPGHEYEDDYCYAQIIHGLVTDRNERGHDLLAQFQRYLEGKTNSRFLTSKALLNKDQQGFDLGFQKLLFDREREIAADIKRGQIESPQIIVSRRIFIEGLAILRLAERVGLKLDEEYEFCPSIARVPMTEPFPGE
jgi:hypothetical protein